MTSFYTILTNYGKTVLAQALAAQQPLEIPHMAAGDGGGTYYDPVEEQTNLRNELWRGDLNDLRTDANVQGQVIAEAIIPMGIDGDWTVREIGLFDDKGGLIAVGKYPENYIPPASSGAKSQVHISIIINVDNVAAVQLIVDHGQVLASKHYVEKQISSSLAVLSSELGAAHIGTSSGLTVQQIIDRGTIYIDDLITSRNGDVDASAPINALLEQIRSMTDRRWIAKVVGTRGARYRFDSMIDTRNVSGIEIDFGLATIVDNVQGVLPSGRANHTFLSYDNKGVKIKNIIYEVAPTRSNTYDQTGISPLVFWVGGQYHGDAETTGTEIENFYSNNAMFNGGMVATAVGETKGFKLKNFNIIGGLWKFGVNLEWGTAPVDPAIDDTDNNGRHPHSAIIESFNGTDIYNTEAFLRTAATYNVKFINCNTVDVAGAVYLYSGDKGISRCSPSVTFENCKFRLTSKFPKATNLISILILDTLNGATQPSYINRDAYIEFNNCESIGILNGSSCLRLIGNAGISRFENCKFKGATTGTHIEPNASISYNQYHSASFRDCVFDKNMTHLNVTRVSGTKFEHCKFLNQHESATSEPIKLGSAANFTEFESCLFNGKITESYINIDRAVDCKFYKNVFVKSGIDGAMIKSNTLTYGLHNRSDTQILSLLLSDKRMIGEDSTSVKSIDSLVGEIIDYECVTTCTSSNSGKIISQINSGKIGDVIEFRGVATASSVKFLNA
ncbi:TPA: phage tail protein, partial [Providencia rettgeri]